MDDQPADKVAVIWFTGNPAVRHIGNVWKSDEHSRSKYLYVYLVDDEDKKHYGSDVVLVNRRDATFIPF